ncbi:S-layer homology domain-containing protein [Brevibacillus sp. AG]|uniref:S-layer homology domain-containing protein n=1 Tax=Brevibacillus sp. AG TaxID=3020891 RepID=UPI00233102B8|nr:S-layer homology domain-containing protein [Brevibacillus sp. AG]MDC0764244.1 S-layer homology domain-containing protein [Brevibacillus sp. AG]
MKKQVNGLLVATLIATGVLTVGGTPAVSVAKAQKVATKSDYSNHQYKEAIDYVISKKVMWKYADESFKPDAQMTQGQFLTSLVTLMQLKEKASVSQVPVGHWAKDVYEKASKAGILSGIKIDPNKGLSKEEASLLIVNAWKPYRGGKNPILSNYQYMIARKWMEKVWGQTGESAFLRGEGAAIFKLLHMDFNGMILGRQAAEKFHASLKIQGSTLTGIFPKVNGLNIFGVILKKDNTTLYFKAGDKISIKANDVKFMSFTSQLPGWSQEMSSYEYLELPKLTRKNVMIRY